MSLIDHDGLGELGLSFWRRRAIRRMRAGLLGLGGVVVYGVLGYIWQGWSPSDALYMVAITVSTVGFTEVQPLDSDAERLHTMAVIALGTIAVAYTVGNFLAFLTEGEIEQFLGHHRVRRRIEELKDHTVVTGYGRMGSLLCTEMAAADVPFVLIERDPDRVPELDRQGILYVLGDATEEDVLKEAGLLHARALVTTVPSDADNVFITLTARQMAPRVLIVARAEMPTTAKKLKQAGADHVVQPAMIGARRIASLLTNPKALEFAELVTDQTRLAIELQEIPVQAGQPLNGLSLRDADVGRRTGCMVVAIKRSNGRVEFPPSVDEVFRPGDVIVLLGRRENFDQFREAFGP